MKNKEWTIDEIEFLKTHYPIKGFKYCFEHLSRTKRSIKKKIERLRNSGNTELRHSGKVINEKFEKNTFSEIIKNSYSYTEVAEKIYGNRFYGNRQTIKRYIQKYNLNIDHFDFCALGYKIGHKPKNKIELSVILVDKSEYVSSSNLRERLYKEGLKKEKCELCGQGPIWMSKKMSLRLDHINGVNNDNRIENLRIICPNCDATLDTFSGKNVKRKNNGPGA